MCSLVTAVTSIRQTRARISPSDAGVDFMPEFNETKNLLDEINTTISGYDPVLKEYARDILLRAMFGWEMRAKPSSSDQSRTESADLASDGQRRGLTLGDYAKRWSPRTMCDRALLSLYYLKNALGMKSATGYQISKELRENGMAPANISVAMHENVRLLRARSRVISGIKGTKQAKNEYAITIVGIQYVESRFNMDYNG